MWYAGFACKVVHQSTHPCDEVPTCYKRLPEIIHWMRNSSVMMLSKLHSGHSLAPDVGKLS